MSDNKPAAAASKTPTQDYDVVIVGAGIAGIYMLHKARQLGFSAVVFEKASGPGGTWFWNRYPGAQCDVPSLEYSYSFDEDLQQEWEWSEHHARQPEIEKYINHVVDRLGLRDGMRFNTAVNTATWSTDEKRWTIETDQGDAARARFCVMTTGGYHTPVVPDIPGLSEFQGETYYTTQWPLDEPSFDGKRVGIIGTGSSGVQTATALAKEPVARLTVFQRTPGYVVPSRDHKLDPEYVRDYKSTYAERRARARRTGYGTDVTSAPVGEGRTRELPEDEFLRRAETVWQVGGGAVQTVFPDFVVDAEANDRVAEYLRSKVREAVDDPELAEKLSPRGHYLGAKRIVITDGYFEIFNQPNVELVDLRESPIEEITEHAVRTAEGEYPVDVLILATGFDSATGSMLAIDITGADGATLQETWANGHFTFLGLGIPGFPNLFMVAQAGSPGIRSHVMVSAEQHVDWIGALLVYMQENGVDTAEATEEAATKWTTHLVDVAASTLLTIDDTQHLGSNVPGKPRVVTSYLGGVAKYRDICDWVAETHYEGWRMRRADGTLVANNPEWEGPAGVVSWENRDEQVGRTANVI